MSTVNVELYELLKGLGADPLRAQAASVSPVESGLREIEMRLRDLEASVSGLKVMARIALAGIGAILLIVAGVLIKVLGG